MIFRDLDKFDELIENEFGSDANARKSLANMLIASNPDWKEAQKRGIQEVSQTDEWKENQLHGTRTVRANNSQWQKNVKLGATKREQNMGKQKRLKVNRDTMATPEWKKAQKEGSQNRYLKEENFTTCPHCGKEVDNANYKRWHGNNCKHK